MAVVDLRLTVRTGIPSSLAHRPSRNLRWSVGNEEAMTASELAC